MTEAGFERVERCGFDLSLDTEERRIGTFCAAARKPARDTLR